MDDQQLNKYITDKLSAGRELSQEELRSISNLREMNAREPSRTPSQLSAYMNAVVPGIKVVNDPTLDFGEYGFVDERVPGVMNVNPNISPPMREMVKLHEQEHTLKNRAVQGMPRDERIDNDVRFDQLYGDESGRTRREIAYQFIKNRDKIEKFFGVPLTDSYFKMSTYKQQGPRAGALFEEQIASLSALEQVTGKSLTKGLPELFPDDKAASIYDAITGLRQTRLDAKDLPPYTPQSRSTMDWIKSKLPVFRAEGSPEYGEMAEQMTVGTRPTDQGESKADKKASEMLRAVSEGVRGFLGLDAIQPGSEAYRTGQALANMPGVGVAAGAIKGSKKLTDLEQFVANKLGSAQGKRLQQAADEIPGLEDQYSSEALLRALRGGKGAPYQGLVTLDPKDFEKFASPLNEPLTKSSAENIEKLQWVLRDKKGFDEVPMLIMDKEGNFLPRITGHEGRHRNRALAAENMPKTLVEIIPSRNLEFPGPGMENRTGQDWRDLFNTMLDERDRVVRAETKSRLNPEVELLRERLDKLTKQDNPDWEKISQLEQELEQWRKSKDYVVQDPARAQKLPRVYKNGGEVLSFIKNSGKRR